MFSRMNTPVITVIILLDNTSPTLFEQSIKSIKNQTFTDYEVIVINNDLYSHRQIDIIFEKYKEDNWYFFNKERENTYQSYVFGFWKAKGKYITICSPNDIQFPERFEYQYNFLKSNDYHVLYSNVIYNDNTMIDSSSINFELINQINCFDTIMFVNNDELKNIMYIMFEDLYDDINVQILNYFIVYKNYFKIFIDDTIVASTMYEKPCSVTEYSRIGLNKLKNNLIYYNQKTKVLNSDLTCIIPFNEKWIQFIEQTLFNIRFTSNNVKIYIVNYDNCDISYIEKYLNNFNVSFYHANDYCDAINTGISKAETDNVIVISNPIRFYKQNWDIDLIRNLKENTIIQPNLSSIIFNTNNNQTNIAKTEIFDASYFSIRYGEKLELLKNYFTSKLNEYKVNDNFNNFANIPIIDDDLIFAIKKENFVNISGCIGFNSNLLLNVFISVKNYLNNGTILIDKDFICGTVNLYSKNQDKLEYYVSMYKLIYLLFNETKYMYEDIIKHEINEIDKSLDFNELIKLTNDELNEVKKTLDTSKLSDFLKYINSSHE